MKSRHRNAESEVVALGKTIRRVKSQYKIREHSGLPKPSVVLEIAAQVIDRDCQHKQGPSGLMYACVVIGETITNMLPKTNNIDIRNQLFERANNSAMEYFSLLRPSHNATSGYSWFDSPLDVSNQQDRITALLLAAQLAKADNK